jgi:hypothetical protein
MSSIGTVTKTFVSSTALLDKREILPMVSDIHNDAELTDIMWLAKRYKVADQGTYHNFVNEGLYLLIDTTGATVTGSGTATVNTKATAATSGFVRKGELIIFPNKKVGVITDITYNSSTGDLITIKSIDGTNLTHTAAQKLSPFSNVVGEKSKTPDNRRYGLTKYLNKLQIFRERNSITDVQNMSTVEVQFGGKNYIVYKDLFEKAIKHRADINAAMIGGVMSNLSWEDASPAFTDPINSGNLQTTGGMDWYIETYGVKDQVGTLGTVALADMEDFNSQMIAAKAPKNLWRFNSNAVGTKFDNMLKALGSSGQIQSAQMKVDGKSIDFTTTSFTYGNFNYEAVYLPILDHPDLFSQTNIVKNAYYVPKDKVKVHGPGGGYQPRMQVRYQKAQVKNNLGSEIYAEWHGGALAPTGPIGDELVWDTYWASTQGLEMLGVQHCARQTVLS